MTRTSQPYIEFVNVALEYTKYVTALKSVNLQIEKGEFVFFLGRTGSGKSTLLKLISHEVTPTSGQVRFDGLDVSSLDLREVPMLRRRMGIVPQDFGLLPRKKAWENIGYAMRAVGKTRRELRKTIGQLLETVNIGHRADAFPTEMSGGEQQRLAIARSLINNPELILADEPTGNLDFQHSIEIMTVLQRLNRSGATVLVATHDMAVVERFGGRRITLANGFIESDEFFPMAPIDEPVLPTFEIIEGEEEAEGNISNIPDVFRDKTPVEPGKLEEASDENP